MIYQYQGYTSLSKTNITNCVSDFETAFYYNYVGSTTNALFCNFEKLEASSNGITNFDTCDGKVERCNYINNLQRTDSYGIVIDWSNKVQILDSVFQGNNHNNKGKLFSTVSGQIYIIKCNNDRYTTNSVGGIIDNSNMKTQSFANNLKFIRLSPCEGEIILVHEKGSKLFNKYRYFLFGKCFVSFLEISNQ